MPSQESARWHEQGNGYAQYLALDAQAAWAELIRYYRIRSEGFASEQRRHLWLVYVTETDVADLSTFEKWERCGHDPAIAVGDHADSRRLGDELRAAGFRGVLSPSAALPGYCNLTLFGERYEIVRRGGLDSVPNPDPTVFLPCALLTGPSAPPPGLTTETCFRGMPHITYRAYLAERGRAPVGSSP